MAEFSLIEGIRQRCTHDRSDVVLGIGDDAAILAPKAGTELVVSMDTLVAGVHFPVATSAFDIGWKALAVNLSDLAAMGAEPAWATLALTLPSADTAWLAEFCDGFSALAGAHRLALVGGDTTRGPLSITLAIHGFVDAGTALRRDGAQVGDRIFVSGCVGDAAAGLQLLAMADAPVADNAHDYLLTRLNRPTPRIALGLALRGIASACIDISDGLLQDLGHIATRSRVAARVQVSALPASAALRSLDAMQRQRCQLSGGDDYELCFTLAPAQVARVRALAAALNVDVTDIGEIQAGAGVQAVDAHGEAVTLAVSGWEHFG